MFYAPGQAKILLWPLFLRTKPIQKPSAFHQDNSLFLDFSPLRGTLHQALTAYGATGAYSG
jgi:hypothetical protein